MLKYLTALVVVTAVDSARSSGQMSTRSIIIIQHHSQPSHKLPKIILKHLLISLLLLVHLLPIWIVKYFPTQDGPSHIYNAQLFKEYHDHQNFRIRDVYQLNWTPFPNWTTHLLMAMLMYIFPPWFAKRSYWVYVYLGCHWLCFTFWGLLIAAKLFSVWLVLYTLTIIYWWWAFTTSRSACLCFSGHLVIGGNTEAT